MGQPRYFPGYGEDWEARKPAEVGVNADALQAAVDFAMAHEYSGSRDLRQAILEGFSHEPYHKLLGPTKERGGPAGMIIKDGYLLASWGDTKRVDMTFSVTKSYLSTVAGLAVDDGLIRSVDDEAAEYVWDGTFEGSHNSQITWDHLLTQSSDWSGTFLGLHDWADRPPREGDVDTWRNRELVTPGTVMEYNDVRVNVLAYSLLQVWRKPLPEVLKTRVLDPIGASTTWRWFGYDHAWVTMDGHQVQTVTGGGHSGAGLFISTVDHARFGYLFLNQGKWRNRQLLSSEWVAAVQVPSAAHGSYGYMWWLNQGPRKWEQVDDESIYYAAGFGGNFIIVDESRDLLMVTRWLEPREVGEFVAKVLAAME